MFVCKTKSAGNLELTEDDAKMKVSKERDGVLKRQTIDGDEGEEIGIEEVEEG